MTPEEFTRDVAEHGLRADCNPTMELHGGKDEVTEAVMFFYRYLHGIDRRMRETARAALVAPEEKTDEPKV